MARPYFLKVNETLRLNLSNIQRVEREETKRPPTEGKGTKVSARIFFPDSYDEDGTETPLVLHDEEAEIFLRYIDGIGDKLQVGVEPGEEVAGAIGRHERDFELG